jgi:hypothetical protein
VGFLARFLPSLSSGLGAFLNPWVIVAGMALFASGVLSGLKVGSLRMDAYEAKVAAVGAKQAADTAVRIANQKAITEGVRHDYEGRVRVLRSRYATWVPIRPDGGAVSTVPDCAASPDGRPADLVPLAEYRTLGGLCAETTQQLISLQEWIRAQEKNSP